MVAILGIMDVKVTETQQSLNKVMQNPFQLSSVNKNIEKVRTLFLRLILKQSD